MSAHSFKLHRARVSTKIYSKWVVLGVCSVAYFLAYFHRVSTAVIAADITTTFKVTSTALGLLSSMYFYAYAAMQIPVGIIADKYSAKLVIIVGLLASALGSLIFGISKSYTVAIIGRIMTGAGAATIYIPALKLISDIFDSNHFGTMTGILVAIGNLGALSASTPYAMIVNSVGWRNSFFVISAITIIVSYFAFHLLPQKFSSRNKQEYLATEDGINAINKARDSNGHPVLIWLLAIAVFLRYGPLMGYQGLWGIPYLTEVLKMNKVNASSILMTISIGYIIGGPFIGSLNDKLKIDTRFLLPLVSSLCAISWSPLAFMTNNVSSQVLYLSAFFLGFMGGGAGVLGFPIARTLSKKGKEATGMSIVNTFSLAGGAVFQPLMGRIIDVSLQNGGSLTKAYSLTFSTALFSTLASAMIAGLIMFNRRSRVRL